MKAKSNVPKKENKAWWPEPKPGKLPEWPVQMVDLPDRLPKISAKELSECLNALFRYNLARADYERKRAEITLKLLSGCEIEFQGPGGLSAKLDEEGRVVIRDSSSAGEVDTQICP